MSDPYVRLQARLDEAKSRETLNRDIAKLQKKLNKLKLKPEIDPKAISALTKKLDRLLSQQQTTSIGRNMGNQITQGLTSEITQSVTQALEQAEDVVGSEMQKLTAKSLSGMEAGLESGLRSTTRTEQTFTKTLTAGIKDFSSWLQSSLIGGQLVKMTRQALTTVRELDTAMNGLAAASSMTATQLESFYNSANDIARQTGITTQEILHQATAWTKLGFTGSEAVSRMTKLSAQLRLLSPSLTSDGAVSALSGIMEAYGIEAADALDGILSKITAVGRRLTLGNDELLAMLQTSASAMADADNTLDETLALEAAAFAVTRDTGVADGLQSAALKLRGIQKESTEADASLRNLQATLHDLTGVSVTENLAGVDTYKSTYQILKEISTVWDSLSDTAQTETLELLFGQSHSSAGASLLSDFSNVENAMDAMAHSAGDAKTAMTAAMDSIDYKLNQIKETGTGIAQNLFNREDMKTVLDIVSSLGNALDFLTDKLGLFGTIGAGAGLYAGFQNIGKGRMSVRISKPIICYLF